MPPAPRTTMGRYVSEKPSVRSGGGALRFGGNAQMQIPISADILI